MSQKDKKETVAVNRWVQSKKPPPPPQFQHYP